MQEEKGRRAGAMSLSQGQKGSRAHVAAPAFTSAQTHVQSRAGGPWAVSGPWAVRQILPPPVCAWCPPLQRPCLSPSLLPEPTSLTFGCHLASSPGPELVTTSKRRTLLTATAGPLRMESQCRRCLASCPLPKLRREGPAGEGCARIHVPLRHSEAGHGSPTPTCQAPSSQQADLGDNVSR